MSGLVMCGVLLALALLALRYGADSRDRNGWTGVATMGPDRRGNASADLRALRRWLARAGATVVRLWLEQEAACEALWRVQQPWLAERARRERGELRWRRARRGQWRLEGRLLPRDHRMEH